jgi:quercetin dioxygenase-like cupin family protein
MRRPQMLCGALWLSALLLAACGGNPERADAPAPGDPVTAAPDAPIAGPGQRLVPTPTAEAGRPFLRVKLDELDWKPIEGDTSGVQQVVVEGNPSQPGYYLVINKFPAGIMSRPHYHPDERHAIVLRGTWYTDEGDVFRPTETVPLKPGDYMRHPAGAHHYDGALDEEVIVAISGMGPSGSTVLDGGPRFGKSR